MGVCLPYPPREGQGKVPLSPDHTSGLVSELRTAGVQTHVDTRGLRGKSYSEPRTDAPSCKFHVDPFWAAPFLC